MKRTATTTTALAAFFACSSSSFADAGIFEGCWVQIYSSAEECPKCQIQISRDDQKLTVAANNGWSANLHEETPFSASGIGRWHLSLANSYQGKFFRLAIRRTDDRLYAIILNPQDEMRAAFKRCPTKFGLWKGSR